MKNYILHVFCYACPESTTKASEETQLRGARPDISQVSNYGMSANEGAPAMCRQLKTVCKEMGLKLQSSDSCKRSVKIILS